MAPLRDALTPPLAALAATFGGAAAFNQPLNSWDTSSVTTLGGTHGIAWHSRALARRLCG